MEDHLSLAEAAERLGISERSAYRWVKSGKLRAYKPGRDYWIPESAVTEIIEQSLVRPKKVEAPPSQQLTLNGELAEERRAAEYQRWADFVDLYASRWERRIETGDFDRSSLDELYAFIEDIQPTLLELGLQEKHEQSPEYIHTWGPVMSQAIMRLYHLFEPLIPAVREKFDDTELDRARRRRAEQEATFGEAIRRGA